MLAYRSIHGAAKKISVGMGGGEERGRRKYGREAYLGDDGDGHPAIEDISVGILEGVGEGRGGGNRVEKLSSESTRIIFVGICGGEGEEEKGEETGRRIRR